VASEQTISQRRFTVIELPVLSLVGQSLLLPLKYFPELVKYGSIPFLLSLVVSAIDFLLTREDVSRTVTAMLMATAHLVLFTPFSVTWTKLAIEGRVANVDDPPFAYSRTQWLYLLTSSAMLLLLGISVGVPFGFVRYGQLTFNNEIITLAGMLLVAGFLIFVLVFIRLSFIFPAIAVGKYAGISAAWRQTAGNVERLAAIVVLSAVPFYAVRKIVDWSIGYHPPSLAAAAHAGVDMLLVALATSALAAPALAYKTIVLDERQDSPAV
jgi:hypothetical protein